LDAYNPEARAYWVFRVNRISEVRPTGMHFTRHADYNFAQRHRHSFSVFVGDTVQRVRVRFAKRIAPFIREACWHHSQQFKEEPDGSLLFEVEVNEPREVGWWVLQWGARGGSAGTRKFTPRAVRDRATNGGSVCKGAGQWREAVGVIE